MKSSYSGNNGNCVEVAALPRGVRAVRDSKDPHGQILFAGSTLTDEERRERAERSRAYLAKHFGVEVTDEESAAMSVKIRDAFARQRAWNG